MPPQQLDNIAAVFARQFEFAIKTMVSTGSPFHAFDFTATNPDGTKATHSMLIVMGPKETIDSYIEKIEVPGSQFTARSAKA